MESIIKKIEQKNKYKMFQIRLIHFLSHIWSKEIQFQSYDIILIISPHPDDEVIGCAGLIQKMLKQKKEVYVLMVTEGEAVWENSLIDREELIAKRKEFMLTAARIIGLPYDHYIHLKWSDGKLSEAVSNHVKQHELVRIIESIKPSLIILPHPLEISGDHNAMNELLSHSLKISNRKIKIFYNRIHSIRFLREFILGWKKSFILSLSKEEYQTKIQALDAYYKPLAPFGKPYSGEFAKSLLFSMKWNKELFFEAD